jgi:peptidoglycan/LPS O-acetylase OafA/YrhL
LCDGKIQKDLDLETENRRFHLLDGLRGIAAIVVVTGHMPKIWLAGEFSHFYLAVDLFFMLSGFVIAFAYENRLLHGLTAQNFMLIRYIRLYPLYIFGTVIGIISGIIAYKLGKGDLSLSDLLISIPTGLLMLPSPIANTDPGLIPLNPPAWSLLFELLMNFCYALFLFRLSTKKIALIVVLSAVVLIATDLHLHSLHTGMTWPTIQYGVARVVFPYCFGILIFRVMPTSQVSSAWAYALPFSVLLIFMGHGARPEVTELLGVVLAFPVIVAAGASFDVPKPGLFEFLGMASYAIYVTSVPVITLTSRVLHTWHFNETALRPWFGYVVIAGLLALAYLLDAYDKRARQMMKEWLRARKSASEVLLKL